jgi:hypothetical protein
MASSRVAVVMVWLVVDDDGDDDDGDDDDGDDGGDEVGFCG